ncbi:hypothetical protein KTH73_13105 [Acinetobacter courvalinii]|jgi:hypothetical protein|uniref:hypothetical protein n=1 Tax=Acinetobacter TaxID=469 RepID=UPI0021CDC415|nr:MULTISPECIES: hypothetical protein [Acinetobacter]MCU4391653.1 hypothetical protein [Acinetobacter courvalinii]MDR2061737.1 hypothetical protein [Acinetobacter sp.]
MYKNQILFIFIMMLCCGCTSSLKPVGAKPVERFEKVFTETHLIKSKTTKTDVIALYGTTRDKTLYPDNTEIWNYYAEQSSPETVAMAGLNNSSGIGKPITKSYRENPASIAIYFNAQGVMSGYAISD